MGVLLLKRRKERCALRNEPKYALWGGWRGPNLRVLSSLLSERNSSSWPCRKPQESGLELGALCPLFLVTVQSPAPRETHLGRMKDAWLLGQASPDWDRRRGVARAEHKRPCRRAGLPYIWVLFSLRIVKGRRLNPRSRLT